MSDFLNQVRSLRSEIGRRMSRALDEKARQDADLTRLKERIDYGLGPSVVDLASRLGTLERNVAALIAAVEDLKPKGPKK